MAQYRGVVQGGRGEASRLGHKTSGLQVEANGWDIGAEVSLSWNEEEQRDELSITINSGSNNNGLKIPIGTFALEDDHIEKVV
ncbi:hypothetical protein [Desulfogranum marinum]|uniref:hypothetical protein n=1 Tax=Desulfogranum marinum TaxID=453220 RepID=UPI0019662200|nr:hypothetical protein [Desulfogranum marinum]MBM9514719.1 hypothetical protein [Desulfogranum marinum]